MKIRLFGEVAVESSEGVAGAGPPLQRKMLALLALRAGASYPLDRLIDEMWGEEAPRNAEAMVRNYAAGIRKIFEPGRPRGTPSSVLETERGGYRLAVDEDSVDIFQFERLVDEALSRRDTARLARALSMWRDTPLVEFPYDDFAIVVRDRLDRRRVDAIEEQLATRLQFEATPALVADLEDMVVRHPARERFWELLMRALYRSGNQPGALRAYDRYVGILLEWGLEPDHELAELAGAIARRDDVTIAGAIRGNLPAPVDRFVGRRLDMDDVAAAIEEHRLITLVGAGGSGKTRLALEVARRHSSPAWLVDLAPVSDDRQVADAVVDAMGLSQSAVLDPLELVIRSFGNRSALLLMDNCEHVRSAAAEVVARLLASCPELTVLATSREALRVPGEVLRPVMPLSTPELATAESILASESGMLLADRARAVTREFAVTAANAEAIESVLRKLEGIPLVIELVAVLLQTSSIDEIAATLAESITSFPDLRHAGPVRHRTVKAALEWSYHLLDPAEQQVFRSLGVLLGEFDFPAAEALGATRRTIHALVSKSMVVRPRGGRYRLLIPLREYAVELLDEHEELDDAVALRNAYFEKVALELGEGRRPFEREDRTRRFLDMRVHLTAAIDAFDRTDPSRSVAMMLRLVDFWGHLGLYTDGVRLALRAADRAENIEDRFTLEIAVVHMLTRGGDLSGAGELAQRTAREADLAGVPGLAASATNVLGSNHAERGNLVRARTILLDAADRYDRHRPEEWFVPRTNLGAVLVWSGDLDGMADVIALIRGPLQQSAPPSVALMDAAEGVAARMAGRLEEADRILAETLENMGATSSAFHRSWVSVERAIVKFELGDHAGAEELVGRALTMTNDVPVFNSLRGGRVRAASAIERGDFDDARAWLAAGTEDAVRSDAPGRLAEVVETAAHLAEAQGDSQTARILLGTADEMRRRLGVARDPYESEQADLLRDRLSASQEPLEVVDDPVPLLRRFLKGGGSL